MGLDEPVLWLTWQIPVGVGSHELEDQHADLAPGPLRILQPASVLVSHAEVMIALFRLLEHEIIESRAQDKIKIFMHYICCSQFSSSLSVLVC